MRFFVLVLVGLASAANNLSSPYDVCKGPPLSRVQWIIKNMDPSGSWGRHTHRAIIALAVNKWAMPNHGVLITLQRDITQALLRNSTSAMPVSELALHVHALIAAGKNPKYFLGIDLVSLLLQRVNAAANVAPFWVLSLCNSRQVAVSHLQKISKFLDGSSLENKAIALKAFACAESLDSKILDDYRTAMDRAASSLAAALRNGQNVYTTSLIVQALTAWGKEIWEEDKALDLLQKEAEINLNIVKAYYIELALNARDVTFIKDLHGPFDKGLMLREISIRLTKIDYDGDTEVSLIVKIPHGGTFLQAMKAAAKSTDVFRFRYVEDLDEKKIYEIGATPNDAERDMAWYICHAKDLKKSAGRALKEDVLESESEEETRQKGSSACEDESRNPTQTTDKLAMKDGDHVILVYTTGNSPCKVKTQ